MEKGVQRARDPGSNPGGGALSILIYYHYDDVNMCEARELF
jgi:hypothetical protein